MKTTLTAIAAAALLCRERQKIYFEKRNRATLANALNTEHALDRLLEQWQREILAKKRYEQQDLLHIVNE